MTACAHIALLAVLWSLVVAPPTIPAAKPLWVAVLAADTPPPEPSPLPPTARRTPPPAALSLPPPAFDVAREVATVAPPQPAATPAPAAVAAASTEPGPPPGLARPAPPAPPTPPPTPRLLRVDQVSYRVTPPAEVPLLSRRAGEHGVVWLRVLIDTQGRPARVSLHRSSGFKRLDEQALAAMTQARFAPQIDNGVAVEVEVLAPIEYPAD